jgi:beta-phosphoglucomutase-like phosphatase (HAD superfamily)
VAAKVERIVEVKNRVTRDHLPAFVRFDPSLYCLFSGLEKLGVRLCVVTNAIRETAEACCRILKVDSIVDHLGAPVVGLVSPSDGFRPKPAWDIYDAAVSHVGLAPRECLAVEDNEKGVTSAAAAGCNVWKVSWPADVTAAALWVEAAKYGGFA